MQRTVLNGGILWNFTLSLKHTSYRYNIETLPFFSCPQAAKWQFLSDRVRKIFACKDKYDPKVLWLLLLLLLEDTIIRHGYFMRWCRVSAVVSSILEIRSWFVVYKKFPYKNIALRLFIIVTIINFHFRFRFCVPICEWLSWKKIIVIDRIFHAILILLIIHWTETNEPFWMVFYIVTTS